MNPAPNRIFLLPPKESGKKPELIFNPATEINLSAVSEGFSLTMFFKDC